MKIELFAMIFLCLGGMLAVSARSVDDRQDGGIPFFSDKSFDTISQCSLQIIIQPKMQKLYYLFASNSSGDDDQILVRRYAESTLASDLSKIMDSLLKKNFVNSLLTPREKRSEYV